MAGVVNRLPHVLHEIGLHGTSVSLPLNITLSPGSGTVHAAGAGTKITLSIVDKPASGRMVVLGNGQAVSLASPLGKAAGTASIYVFTGPTSRVTDYMAPPLSRRFVASTEVGLTTWRDSLGWHSQLGPTPQQLAGADVVFAGGRVHPLPAGLRADLIAAGLDTYITLQEVRQ